LLAPFQLVTFRQWALPPFAARANTRAGRAFALGNLPLQSHDLLLQFHCFCLLAAGAELSEFIHHPLTALPQFAQFRAPRLHWHFAGRAFRARRPSGLRRIFAANAGGEDEQRKGTNERKPANRR